MYKTWIIVALDDVGKPYIHSSYDSYQDAVDSSYDLCHNTNLNNLNHQIVELEL